MTKPSLSASKGLEASSGVSLNLVESARMREKPATASGWMHASVPPASMALAWPNWISLAASPMALAPVAQAVTGAILGPFNLCWRLTLPAAIFCRIFGMKCGETFLVIESRHCVYNVFETTYAGTQGYTLTVS
jgi:hypothetical protein